MEGIQSEIEKLLNVITVILLKLGEIENDIVSDVKLILDHSKTEVVLIQRSKLYLGIIKNSKGQYSEVLSAEVQPPKIFSVHNSKLILLFRSKNEKDELNLRGCVQNSEISTDKRKGFCALIRQKPLQKPFFLSQLGGVCQNVTLQGPPR